MFSKEAAFLHGFCHARIYDNPYPDGETLASIWVDGWIAGFKEYGPRSEGKSFQIRQKQKQ